MTSFTQLDSGQKDAFKELMLRSVDRKIREDNEFTTQIIKLLILGNGAGIVVVSSFMGAIAAGGGSVAVLASPLWVFFLGCISSAFVYIPLAVYSINATEYIGNQAIEFFMNKVDVEDLTGYHLNKKGRCIVYMLLFASFVLFGWGVFQSISLLERL